jgi:nuclear transport factor 2 (NTF2) superfamily protein
MSKAIIDPAEVRRFALELKRFNDFLQQQGTVVTARMNELGQTWRDQEHVKFAEEFDSTMKQLMRFTLATEKHIPFLLRKAEKIEEYLNQR